MKKKPIGIAANLNSPEIDCNYINELQKEIIEQVLIELEHAFIEGLKRHGYEFESKQELECFVKENCTCMVSGGTKTYTVNGVPFFAYYEGFYFDIEQAESNLFNMKIGTYRFL